MRRSLGIATILLVSIGAVAGCQRSESTPTALTSSALADRITQAHGGMEAWNGASSVRYEHTLYFPERADGATPSPWVSREVVERGPAGRVYQDWTSHGGTIAWDGSEVWSTDWVLGNPPKMMPYLVYYGLVAPWVAHDPNVTLDEPGREAIPGDSSRTYVTLTIRMPRDPSRPPTAGYLKIFADPESYEMKALSYNVTYGPMLDIMGLPPGMAEMGPITHVYDEYAEVGGLRVPVKYHTVGPDGSLAGTHDVKDWSFDQPFDEGRMRKPADAVVDDARDERRVAS